MLTQQEFNDLAKQGYNRIPLVRSMLADLDTPLSLYLKLANRPFSYLLESVEGGERFGRYSFIGLPAKNRLVVKGQHVRIHNGFEITHDAEVADPLHLIDNYLKEMKVYHRPGEPRFMGGLAGYFGYETVAQIEPRLKRTGKPDPLGVPDMLLLATDELAVVDNLSGTIYLVVYADPRHTHAYERACARLDELHTLARRPAEIPATPRYPYTPAVSEFGEEAYKKVVEKAKQYIRDGDIMQVVPSQRMSAPFPASPLTLYRALRTVNPSPYMFYYDFDDFHVVGASPEILVRLEDGSVTVRPIAGTRPRGKTRAEDEALATELLADPKELAEHLMLVDLGRNDVGRVAVTGSVKVTERMVIERYSHVMHIVSNVEGKLRPGLSGIDVLRATFPAGTVSGAPKVRAMEIIDEVEPTRRGVYAGAVGYLGYQGDMDLAIAIRTAVVKNGTLYVQSGGGLVADSVPESEWMETQNKARAVLRAAELACNGLAE